MKDKKFKSIYESKIAIVLISGSAGELDWILPIIDFLLLRGFKIKIIFLSRHAYISVQKNRMLNDYIFDKMSTIKVYLCGGFFSERIEHYCYLVYRISIKLRLSKKPIIKIAHNLISKFFDKIFRHSFLTRLPSEILSFKSNKCLIFSEYPSLRRPRDLWLREEFNRSIFFYHPHSPHIYTKNLDKIYSDTEPKNYNTKYYFLLGHPGDYYAINDGREYSNPNLEKFFIGHPKYSYNWLKKFIKDSHKFRSSLSTRNEFNILVLSRGSGSYFDENTHEQLIETTIDATIKDQTVNCNLLVKKHPRELNSYWDKIQSVYPKINIINDHILKIATSVDLVITYWSSGAMDCYELGVPVIEFYDPNKHPKQQVLYKNSYTTIYRKLDLVHAANNKSELKKIIKDKIKNISNIKSEKPHPFYIDLIKRSNNWQKVFENILTKNNLL